MEHALIEKMLLCRRFDEEIIKRYPKQLMRCPVHLGLGQEAIAVGVCHHLHKEDSVFSTHRNHSHYLAKGGDMEKFALEIHGKSGGCNGGRGGSMHALDKSVNFMSGPIVASAIPLAVGAAMANKINGNDNIVVCFFGDAAVEEGVFHESMNFASLHQLPIIFVCENNQYSVDTHISKRQTETFLRYLTSLHGVRRICRSGHDVFKVAELFEVEIDGIRKGNGPLLVVLDTERSHVHCGIDKEFELKCDPLDMALGKEMSSGRTSAFQLVELDNAIKLTIAAAFDNAESVPLPTPDMASKYVYA